MYWDQKAWEGLVTDFVTNTLEEIDREEWTLKFGKALQSQFSLYLNFPDDKVILYSLFTLKILLSYILVCICYFSISD